MEIQSLLALTALAAKNALQFAHDALFSTVQHARIQRARIPNLSKYLGKAQSCQHIIKCQRANAAFWGDLIHGQEFSQPITNREFRDK